MMDLFSIILLLAAAHGVFLAISMLTHISEKRHGLAFLVILIVAFALDLFHEFLTQTQLILEFDGLRYVDPWINLFYGSALFLYVSSLTQTSEHRKPWCRAVFHFMVPLIALGLIAQLPSLTDERFLALLYNNELPNSASEHRVIDTVELIAKLSVTSLTGYLLYSFVLLYSHNRHVKSQFSSVEEITLNWLKILVGNIFFMYLILIFGGFFWDYFASDKQISVKAEHFNQFLYLIIAGSIYTMGYLGMKQTVIFKYQPTVSENLDDNDEVPERCVEKYSSSALDETLSKQLKEVLGDHMQEQKPFLMSQLTLAQLAEQLHVPPNYVSQVINQNFSMNFFDFVNAYRIEYAKQHLGEATKSQKTILDIAFESGFNSKSAFYAAFKKHTGLTPSQYKLKLQTNEAAVKTNA